jgi:hypothetical protein
MAYSKDRQYCCVRDGGVGACTHLSFGKHQGFPASGWIWKLLKIRLVKNPQETSRMTVAIKCSCESPVWSVSGQGHTKETGNQNFWELLSAWVEHVEQNGAVQCNSQKTEKLNSQATEQASLLTVALLCSFQVSAVLMCFCDSFVSFDSTKGWWSCWFCFCAVNWAEAWYVWLIPCRC